MMCENVIRYKFNMIVITIDSDNWHHDVVHISLQKKKNNLLAMLLVITKNYQGNWLATFKKIKLEILRLLKGRPIDQSNYVHN